MQEFLHAPDTIPIHSTTVPNASSVLNFSFDTDGICVEFHKLQGLQGGLHYLFLPRLCGPNLVNHYHFIKKHVDLRKYSADGVTVLKHCVGHTMAYVDGGYHLLMTALPADAQKPDSRLLCQDLYNVIALELLNSVIYNFHDLLKNLPEQEKVWPTIRKQGSFDTSRFHVLWRDATFIMSLLDMAVEKANACHFMKVAIFMNQFGQKDIEPLDITDIVDPSQVRYGLEDLVGVRGALFTALGIHEATNYQSNLDNQPMDVSRELLSVLKLYGKLTFFQLYADSPHAHIQMPFKHPECSDGGLLSVLREVVLCLVDELTSIYHENEGVARYDACWKAYQYELAFEELIHGRPLSPLDNQLSVSLGTSSVSERSLTHQRGFLGLAPHSSASAGETPPPLHNWTRDELQTKRIERLFPLCQTLEAAPSVTGVALVNVLLCDIYKSNTDIPMALVKSDHPPGRLVGVWPLETLCDNLAEKDSFPVPNTFGRARMLVTQAGKDPKVCLLAGFVEAKLNFFPAFKFRDTKGGKRLWWNCRDYVQVHSAGSEPFSISQVASLTLQVCVEIERRSLTYSRNLDKHRDHGMAWMEKVLSRLPESMKKTPNIRLRALTFISSIGMVFNMVIWRLHEDIPYRAVQPPRSVVPKPKPPERPEYEPAEEDVQAVEAQDDLRAMERSQAMCLPEYSSGKWSDVEVSCVPTDRKLKASVAYKLYCEKCKASKILIRSYKAFKHKRNELFKK
ncbi:hypothetical protein ABVT39_021596 [Epinephelus coioides]